MNVLLLMCFSVTTSAQAISDKNIRLSANWQFVKQDLGGVWEAVRPAKPDSPESVPLWTAVTLPHCFNAEDAVDPDVNYYQGPGWYRTRLSVHNPYKNGRTLLHFEGAGQKTDVYVGMDKVGSHVGGYDEWTIDISEHTHKYTQDGNVDLIIRCDNSRDLELIPSNLSDFNVYGGLYRHVNLIYVPENYISQVHITPSISGKQNGTVQLKIDLQRKNSKPSDLAISVKDAQNRKVYETKLTVDGNSVEHNFQLKKIRRWSTEIPHLYSIEIKNLRDGDEQIYNDKFGFREFRFEKNGPFFLNGERLLLRGTHRHEDHAGVAAAMTDAMMRTEMQLMKDMGVNFIRLGHYQQSKLILNLCDSLGILVWEEIPWCRGGLGGEIYKEQARRMLTNMINQHYNHPSVIIWGLGNENDWPGDFPEFNKEKIQDFMRELQQLSHNLDGERKTAIRRCEFCKDIVDVYSPSIWAGWYRGKYEDYKPESHKNMLTVNHFLHVEYGGDSHAGRHDEDPDKVLEIIKSGQGADERAGDASLVGGQARVSKDGNWSESYIVNLFDWHLKEQESMPWLTGAAQWVFKDFSTPVRPGNPVPYMNQKGVVERDFTKKESYYVFQSYWTIRPMMHIYGHTWPVRWGEVGEEKMVKVFSNCKEVELFLNGKSMGIKKRDVQQFPAAGLHWNVVFEKGKNELKAISKGKGEFITDSISFEYQTQKWGKPYRMELTEEPIDEKTSWIIVKTFDKNNVICLDARNRVRFDVAGDATMIDNQGTPSGSRLVEMWNGVAKIKILKSGCNYTASVKSDGLQTALLPTK